MAITEIRGFHNVVGLELSPIRHNTNGEPFFVRDLVLWGSDQKCTVIPIFGTSARVLMTDEEKRVEDDREQEYQDYLASPAAQEDLVLGFSQGYVPDPSCDREFDAYRRWKLLGGTVEEKPPAVAVVF